MKKEQANLDFVKMEHEVLDFWNKENNIQFQQNNCEVTV